MADKKLALIQFAVKHYEATGEFDFRVTPHFEILTPPNRVSDQQCTVNVGDSETVLSVREMGEAYLAASELCQNAPTRRGKMRMHKISDDECHALLQRLIDEGRVTNPGME